MNPSELQKVAERVSWFKKPEDDWACRYSKTGVPTPALSTAEGRAPTFVRSGYFDQLDFGLEPSSIQTKITCRSIHNRLPDH
jgi:hypothetical protein